MEHEKAESPLTNPPSRPYDAIRTVVEKLGGTMTWQPKGAGGDWALELEGKAAIIDCRSNRVNALDRLYVVKVERPETWDDYDRDAPLIPGAFWKLVQLFNSAGKQS